jgi:hypothetical protein
MKILIIDSTEPRRKKLIEAFNESLGLGNINIYIYKDNCIYPKETKDSKNMDIMKFDLIMRHGGDENISGLISKFYICYGGYGRIDDRRKYYEYLISFPIGENTEDLKNKFTELIEAVRLNKSNPKSLIKLTWLLPPMPLLNLGLKVLYSCLMPQNVSNLLDKDRKRVLPEFECFNDIALLYNGNNLSFYEILIKLETTSFVKEERMRIIELLRDKILIKSFS